MEVKDDEDAPIDLVPYDLASKKTQDYMQKLQAATQPLVKLNGTSLRKRGRTKGSRRSRKQETPAARQQGTAAAAPIASASGCLAKPAVDKVMLPACLGTAAAAAAAEGGEERECARGITVDDWYVAAAAQKLSFTWHDAPVGRFYRVGLEGTEETVKLVPHCVINHANWSAQLR